MIRCDVKYHVQPGKRDAFLKALREKGIDKACQAELGNRMYEYSLSEEGPDTLCLTELWVDEDALAAHGKMPHMAALPAIKAEYGVKTDIEKTILPED